MMLATSFRDALVVLLLAVLMLIVFFQAIRLPFVADDYGYLNDVHQPGWWHSSPAWAAWATPFRPVLFLWFGTLDSLFGLHPVPFHIASGLLVLLSGVLTGLIARRLGLAFGAYVAAAVVCLHASMMTVVGWPSAANSAIGSALALGALYLMLSTRLRVMKVIGAVLLFSIALLAREVVAVLPAIVFVARYFVEDSRPFRSRFTRALLASSPLWAVVVLYGIARHASGFTSHAGPYAQHLSLHAFVNLGRLAQIATDTKPASSIGNSALVATFWTVFIGLCVLAATRWGQWQGLFGLAWALFAVLPVVFLAVHGMSFYYIDFALPGLAIAGGTVFDWLTAHSSQKSRTAILAAVVSVFVILGFSTARRQEHRPLDAEIVRTNRIVAQVLRDNPHPPKGSTIVVRHANLNDQYLTANGALFRVIFHDRSLRVTYDVSPGLPSRVVAQLNGVLVACMAKQGVKYPSPSSNISQPPAGVAHAKYDSARATCMNRLLKG